MRNPYPSEIADRFLVRLPDGLRQAIKFEAEKNCRSMNSEIIFHLQQAFSKAETKKADATA